MTIINGKIPTGGLTALSVGGYLQANAAYWFEQWRIAAKKAGFDLTITSVADAYREYAIQERIFRQRYTPVYTQYAAGKTDRRLWLGSYWYRKPGYAAAAVPGTSNHGRGLAVDIKDVGGFTSAFYKWLKATGPDYGFTNTEGASVNEAWHWVHDQRSIPAPKPPTVEPQEEDDMTPDQSAQLASIHQMLAVPGQPYGWPQASHNLLTVIGGDVGKVLDAVQSVASTLAVPGQQFGYPAASHNALGGLIGEVAALKAIVASLSSATGADPAAVQAAAEAGARKALKDLSFTVDAKVA